MGFPYSMHYTFSQLAHKAVPWDINPTSCSSFSRPPSNIRGGAKYMWVTKKPKGNVSEKHALSKKIEKLYHAMCDPVVHT
jgi:hypothetical protein